MLDGVAAVLLGVDVDTAPMFLKKKDSSLKEFKWKKIKLENSAIKWRVRYCKFELDNK